MYLALARGCNGTDEYLFLHVSARPFFSTVGGRASSCWDHQGAQEAADQMLQLDARGIALPCVCYVLAPRGAGSAAARHRRRLHSARRLDSAAAVTNTGIKRLGPLGDGRPF